MTTAAQNLCHDDQQPGQSVRYLKERPEMVPTQSEAKTPRVYSDAVYSFAAEQLQHSESSLHVQAMLVAKGLDEESAADVVDQLCAARAKSHDASRRRRMWLGGILCVGGIVISVVSYVVSNERGGSFAVMTGAIVYGGILFFRALFNDES